MEDKLYRIYYGDGENDYIRRFLKDSDIINGYLSEAKAFELFYSAMIMCNDYFTVDDDLYYYTELVSGYDEELDEYVEQYQYFIIDNEYSEEITTKATEKMGNTLYLDNRRNLYITGITDLGTSRDYVPTDIKVTKENE